VAEGRCLVLGGAGFMGSHLVERLVHEGRPVRVFDLPGAGAKRLAAVRGKVELVEGDFQKAREVAAAVEGCEAVFHLIGTTVPSTSNRDPAYDTETNLLTTLRLLEACVRAKVKQVIFSSSGGTVYGQAQSLPIHETHPTEPRTSYGIVKLAIEKNLELFRHLHGLDYAALRIGNAYGPRLPVGGEQGAVGAFLKCLKHGEPIPLWGDGSAVRDYVYVEDVARAFRAALGQRSAHRVFNIGTGRGTSLRQLIALMERATGRKAAVESRSGRAADVPENVLDTALARQHLGWTPEKTLEEGLALTWRWLESSPEV